MDNTSSESETDACTHWKAFVDGHQEPVGELDFTPDGLERDGGCWKMFRCKASEILRNEAYFSVRRSDEE